MLLDPALCKLAGTPPTESMPRLQPSVALWRASCWRQGLRALVRVVAAMKMVMLLLPCLVAIRPHGLPGASQMFSLLLQVMLMRPHLKRPPRE